MTWHEPGCKTRQTLLLPGIGCRGGLQSGAGGANVVDEHTRLPARLPLLHLKACCNRWPGAVPRSDRSVVQ